MKKQKRIYFKVHLNNFPESRTACKSAGLFLEISEDISKVNCNVCLKRSQKHGSKQRHNNCGIQSLAEAQA